MRFCYATVSIVVHVGQNEGGVISGCSHDEIRVAICTCGEIRVAYHIYVHMWRNKVGYIGMLCDGLRSCYWWNRSILVVAIDFRVCVMHIT